MSKSISYNSNYARFRHRRTDRITYLPTGFIGSFQGRGVTPVSRFFKKKDPIRFGEADEANDNRATVTTLFSINFSRVFSVELYILLWLSWLSKKKKYRYIKGLRGEQ